MSTRVADIQGEPPGPRPGANPIRMMAILDPNEADKFRRLGCRSYNFCLDVAASQKWEGFSCCSCSAYEPMDSEEIRRDMEGMAAMLLAQAVLLRRDPSGEGTALAAITCYVDILRDAHRTLHLNRSILVRIEPSEDGAISVFAPELDIGGVGSTQQAAVADLCQTVISLWEEIGQARADDLDDHAQRFRDKLALLVGSSYR